MAKAKHAGGRPTTYTKELAETICEEIAQGEGLKGICKADDMPAAWTVYRWLQMEKHKEFRGMYTRAREQQQDYWADHIVEIAANDKLDVHRSRLMVDTYKWLMSKLAPRKYGDHKTLEHTGKVEIHVKRITLVDEAAPKVKTKAKK